ncbi:glycosyltransferase [Winogradskyella sediminis]|nr:glycosyltransferase [Winogradskyella sediminis]
MTTLIKEYHINVHSVASKDNTIPPPDTDKFKSYKLKDFTRASLLEFVEGINPAIMVVAGWAVKDFVWVSKRVKVKLNIPVVSYSDTQWQGSWKQRINGLISKWHHRQAFSHLWVAGIYQYEYARKLGFSKNNIIYNSLSCDLELFQNCSTVHKHNDYPKNFLFIGRFVEEKGLSFLLEAWSQILNKNGWTLTLIGDGHLKDQFKHKEGLVVKDFMSQESLIREIEGSGCFILPSIFEPWALVIHEAAAAGLPLIATNVCGAAAHFIISGFNGYQTSPSVEEIKLAMEKIIASNSEQLLTFSANSRRLARTITPELGAGQLMSVLNGRQ